MTPLGSFAVTCEPAEVQAFRAATGLCQGDAVPSTFPMRWLAAPEVRDALLAMAPEPDLVPVHESQTFEYDAPLAVGGRYELQLTAHREATPDRLVLAGTVLGDDVAPRVRIETILRLFSTAAAAA